MRERRFNRRLPFLLPSRLFVSSRSVCRRLPAVSSGINNCNSVSTSITNPIANLYKPCECLCNPRFDQSEKKLFPLFILIMADYIRRQVQEIALGIEDATINLRVQLCEKAINETRFRLIVKPVNPRKQNLRAMLSALPRL